MLVGKVAARQPVALGLDVRGREVAVRGWQEGSGVDIDDALRRLTDAGASAVVVTQIEVEGLMGGADTDGLAGVLGATELDVIASGGIGTASIQVAKAFATLDVASPGEIATAFGDLHHAAETMVSSAPDRLDRLAAGITTAMRSRAIARQSVLLGMGLSEEEARGDVLRRVRAQRSCASQEFGCCCPPYVGVALSRQLAQ